MPEKRPYLDEEIKISSVSGHVVTVTSFGAVNAAEDSEFNVYKNPKTGETLVHGESSKFEYDGLSEAADNGNGEASYCLAAYDAETNSIELVPATLVTISSVIKSKKYAEGPSVRQANVRNVIQRNTLGEAFGTKRAKKAITDLERNRIDAEKLQDLEMAIVDTVKTSTESLPTVEERKEALSQDRPIPPYSLGAERPEDIYPVVDGILPKKEYNAIRVEPIISEKDEKKRLGLLPHKTSVYIASKLSTVLSEHNSMNLSKSAIMERTKLIYYCSLLMAVYHNRRVSNKAMMMVKCSNPAEILITGVLDRFAVAKAGGRVKDKNFVIDPVHENKLLCYLLALILRIDNFVIEIAPLAQELSLKPSKLSELLKAMGCTIKNASSIQAEALGLTKTQAANYKLASLTAPLKLPEVAKRRRMGGGR
jgi:DNA-directed RNA polymerase I subunit RPA49